MEFVGATPKHNVPARGHATPQARSRPRLARKNASGKAPSPPGVRYAQADAPCTAAVRVETGREARRRDDLLAEVWSDIVAWTPGAAVEVLFREGRSTAISVGAGFAMHVSAAAIPDPQLMGEVYRQLVAPELAVSAARSRGWVAGAVVLR